MRVLLIAAVAFLLQGVPGICATEALLRIDFTTGNDNPAYAIVEKTDGEFQIRCGIDAAAYIESFGEAFLDGIELESQRAVSPRVVNWYINSLAREDRSRLNGPSSTPSNRMILSLCGKRDEFLVNGAHEEGRRILWGMELFLDRDFLRETASLLDAKLEPLLK